MTNRNLTDSELLVLGLVAEMPRHGYELEQVIEKRQMREWTQIGFSSIYFVLGKLENKGLISAQRPVGTKAKKAYTISNTGHKMLTSQTLAALQAIRPNYSSVMLGMVNWSVLSRKQALDSLRARMEVVVVELARLDQIHFKQQPLPDNIDRMFEFSIGQLKSEANWISETLKYMNTKPWNI